MNKKVTMLLIAAVAMLLPAVAIADVMVTGSYTVSGSNIGPLFYLSEGPNYVNASSLELLSLGPAPSDTGLMGTVDLEGIVNQTVWEINVLELVIPASTHAIGGNLTISITDATGFGSATMYVSLVANTPQTFGTLTSQNAFVIDNDPSYTFMISPGSGALVYYIGFVLPAGTYSSGSFTLTGTFTS
ncbi:MAG: hypothetical protein M1315_04320 [Candidatus Thermoplasmatota archaeon]|jgi:hypothetical protein|nr:hypothetical protein [Candidatus Thermoplasmatota archaeon]